MTFESVSNQTNGKTPECNWRYSRKAMIDLWSPAYTKQYLQNLCVFGVVEVLTAVPYEVHLAKDEKGRVVLLGGTEGRVIANSFEEFEVIGFKHLEKPIDKLIGAKPKKRTPKYDDVIVF